MLNDKYIGILIKFVYNYMRISDGYLSMEITVNINLLYICASIYIYKYI